MANRKRRARRALPKLRRAPKLTAVSGAWMAVVAICGLVTAVVQSVTTIVVTLISLVIAVVSLFAGQHPAVSTRSATTTKTTSSRGKASRQRSSSKTGTRPSKPRRCGARCRRSTKPVSTCDCSCKGRSHGSEAGRTFTETRAWLGSRTAQQLEKQHVKEREGWRRG